MEAVAIGQIVKGDKERPELTDHLNSTHIVDLAELEGHEDTGADVLVEIKCPSPMVKGRTAGKGTRSSGATPASNGDRYQFGSTEEKYRLKVLGCKQRGVKGTKPMAHSGPTAGVGYVAKQKGQYADGLSKRSVVRRPSFCGVQVRRGAPTW